MAVLRLVTTVRDGGVEPPGVDWDAVRREFPAVTLDPGGGAPEAAPVVESRWWRSLAYDPYQLDRRLGDAATGIAPTVVLELDDGEDGVPVAMQLLTRVQGTLGRTNEASSDPLFLAALERHRGMHPLEKPLVRADFNHALDVWQWTLRLNPEVSLAVQLAALFHDVERLVTEADRRIEHTATDYQSFKDAHAMTGARLTRAMLTDLGCPAPILDRVEALVRDHEKPDTDPEGALLADADALSFFSLNAPGFLDCYGLEHTRRKIAWTIGRMRRPALERVRTLRARHDVDRLVREQLDFLASADIEWGPR